jgi:hypothetical protein
MTHNNASIAEKDKVFLRQPLQTTQDSPRNAPLLVRAPEGTLQWTTSELYPELKAGARLSISETSRAILSTHGNFPNLGVLTHLGSCTSEDG